MQDFFHQQYELMLKMSCFAFLGWLWGLNPAVFLEQLGVKQTAKTRLKSTSCRTRRYLIPSSTPKLRRPRKRCPLSLMWCTTIVAMHYIVLVFCANTNIIILLFTSSGILCMQKCYTTNQDIPIPSMYGIFAYIYHKNTPIVGKYTHTWMLWDL